MTQEMRKNTTVNRKQNETKNAGIKTSNAMREATLKAGLSAIESSSKRASADTQSKSLEAAAFTFSNFDDVQKAQEQAYEYGREAMDGFFKSASTALSSFNQLFDINTLNSDAAFESFDIASEVAQALNQEVSECSNAIMTEQFKAFERFLNCKTAGDLLNLQNDFIKNSLDESLTRFANIAQYWLDFAKVAEPINRSITEASNKLADAWTPESK